MVLSLVLCGALLCICFWGGLRRPCPEHDRDAMLSSFNVLRGLFATEIVIGHAVYWGEGVLLYLLSEFALIGVAYFFFVSACGLAASENRDPKYLQRFVLRKCGYLFSILFICFWSSELLRVLFGCHTGYSQGFLSYFFEHVNWYLWEQMIFYLLFWAAYRFAKQYAVLICTVFVCVAITVGYFLKVPGYWYISSAGFPLGLAYYRYFDRIQSFLLSWKGCAVLLPLLLFGMGSLVFEEGLVAAVYMRNILCVGALLLLSNILSRFSFDNRALRFLEHHSTEIYLYQTAWLVIIPKTFGIEIYTFAVIMLTILQALVMTPVNRSLRRFWEKNFRVK